MSIQINKKKTIKWILIILVLVVISSTMLISNCSSMGETPSGARLERIKASPNYKDDEFVNLVPTEVFKDGSTWGNIKEYFGGDQIRVPPSDLPVTPVSPQSLSSTPLPGLRSFWIGHASVYLEIDEVRILTDPVFAEVVSPVSFIGPSRFHPVPIALNDLPKIDAVVITHDHYDHLDMETIQYLAQKGTQFFVPLGIGAHLEEWEIPHQQIIEMDWWESKIMKGVTIHCTPSRHYSGRGLFDSNKTLWSSWSIIGPQHRVFVSGDTGFANHFETIGNQFGPFDLAVIKIGASDPLWVEIHMSPEEAVEANIDLKGKNMLPVHWGTFNLAYHDWDGPIKRTVKAATEKGVELYTPRIGELIEIGQPNQTVNWWKDIK